MNDSIHFKAKYFQFHGIRSLVFFNVMPLRTSVLRILILRDEKFEHHTSITF